MALDLDRPRPLAPQTPPTTVSPPRPGAPSGPPLRESGPPEPDALRRGPPWMIAAPTAASEPPKGRHRLTPLLGVLATVALAGGGAYLAFGGDEDDDPSPATDPASTTALATFAVDLSTGHEDPSQATVVVPSPTLPLPSIGLPMPGATLPVPTTVG